MCKGTKNNRNEQVQTDFFDLFDVKKNLLASKKNKVKSSMKTCLCEINKLRATTDGSWPELFDSVAWYISMITDEYISLDEELQELEKQREFDGNLYTFN